MKMRWLRLVVPVMAASLGWLAGCGDTLERIEEGELLCDGACRLEFPTINFNRPGDDDAEVSLSNIGSGSVAIREIRLENTSPYVVFSTPTVTYFTINAGWESTNGDRAFETGGQAFNLVPDASESIVLTFLPSADAVSAECPGASGAGSNQSCGELVIVSNDRRTPELRIPITISVGGSRMEVEPTSISFSPPTLVDESGEIYAEQRESFTITNPGSTNLTVGSITASDDNVTVDLPNGGVSFPRVITPGGQQEFDVIWQPRSNDPLDARLTISSDAGVGSVATIFLDSEGGDLPVLRIEPCTFNFPSTEEGGASEAVFTVANDGTAAMTWSITPFNFVPPSARTLFSVLDSDGNSATGQRTALEPGTTADFSLRYDPIDPSASARGELRISGNFGPPRICTFSAGPALPQIVLSPSELWASEVADGDALVRSFVVSNEGQADLEVASIDRGAGVSTEFSLSSVDEGGFTLLPGERRRINLTYDRNADDQQIADQLTLVLQHNDLAVGDGSSIVRFTVRHEGDLTPPVCALSLSSEGPYAVGDTVTLDATGSEFPAGEPTANAYRWNLTRPLGSGTVFTTEFAETQTLTFDSAGTYEVGLIATAVFPTSELSQCELLQVFTVE